MSRCWAKSGKTRWKRQLKGRREAQCKAAHSIRAWASFSSSGKPADQFHLNGWTVMCLLQFNQHNDVWMINSTRPDTHTHTSIHYMCTYGYIQHPDPSGSRPAERKCTFWGREMKATRRWDANQNQALVHVQLRQAPQHSSKQGPADSEDLISKWQVALWYNVAIKCVQNV